MTRVKLHTSDARDPAGWCARASMIAVMAFLAASGCDGDRNRPDAAADNGNDAVSETGLPSDGHMVDESTEISQDGVEPADSRTPDVFDSNPDSPDLIDDIERDVPDELHHDIGKDYADDEIDSFDESDSADVGPEDDGGPETGCAPEVTEGSCRTFIICASNCNDPQREECINDCASRMSADGYQAFSAFNDCSNVWCASLSDPETFVACVRSKCEIEYRTCFSGCTYQTCSAERECAVDCWESDLSANPGVMPLDSLKRCIADCDQQSAVSAQTDLAAAVECTVGQCNSYCADASDVSSCVDCFKTNSVAGLMMTCGNLWQTCNPGP